MKQLEAPKLFKIDRIYQRLETRIKGRVLPYYYRARDCQNYLSTKIFRVKNRKQFLRYLEESTDQYRGIFIQSRIIEWDIPLFQRPQHMARAMAQAGYLVVYITPNILRDHIYGFVEIEPGLYLSNDLNFIHEVSGALISFYSTISWHAPSEIEKIRNRGNKVIYEYVDHIDPKISSTNVDNLRHLYDYVSGDTFDYVFATSKILVEEMRSKFSKNQILYLPNGVDYEHYRSTLQKSSEIPPKNLARIVAEGKPIVGYFGAIAPWLWYDLVDECCASLPDVNFLFIGPDYLDSVRNLPAYNNFLHIGPVEYVSLPDYAQWFSIGIIPFFPGEIAQTTSPLKLYEYFALGKPVVVTSDMLECTAFKEVLHGKDSAQFVENILTALTLVENKKYLRNLDELALSNTWDSRARAVVEHMSAENCP